MKDLVNYSGNSGLLASFPPINRLNDVVTSIHNIMDSVFGSDFDLQMFSDFQSPKVSFPKVNIYESDSNYDVEIMVAGYNKEDINLEIKDNSLLIKSDVSSEKEDSRENCIRKEISCRNFRRFVRFPKKVDASLVDCKYVNGIIKCSVGKLKEAPTEPVKIKID
jgi:HSP20 family protein